MLENNGDYDNPSYSWSIFPAVLLFDLSKYSIKTGICDGVIVSLSTILIVLGL